MGWGGRVDPVHSAAMWVSDKTGLSFKASAPGLAGRIGELFGLGPKRVCDHWIETECRQNIGYDGMRCFGQLVVGDPQRDHPLCLEPVLPGVIELRRFLDKCCDSRAIVSVIGAARRQAFEVCAIRVEMPKPALFRAKARDRLTEPVRTGEVDEERGAKRRFDPLQIVGRLREKEGKFTDKMVKAAALHPEAEDIGAATSL